MRSAKTKLIPDPNKESSLKSVKDQKMMVIIHPGEVKKISQASLKSSSQKVKFVTKFSYDNPVLNSTRGIPNSKKSPRLLNPDRHTDYGSIPILPRDSADSYQPASACTTPPTPCLLEPALTLGSASFPRPRPNPNPTAGQIPQQNQPSRPPNPTRTEPVPTRTLKQPQTNSDPHNHDDQNPDKQQQEQRELVEGLKHKVRTQAQRILELERHRPAPDLAEHEHKQHDGRGVWTADGDDEVPMLRDEVLRLRQEAGRLQERVAEANAVVRKLVLENEVLRARAGVCAGCRQGGCLEGTEEVEGRDWREEGVELVDMEGGSTYQVNISETKDAAIQAPTSRDRAAVARDAHVQTDQAETRSEVSRADFQVDARTQEPDDWLESRVIEHAKQLLLKHLLTPTLSKLSSSQEAIKYLSVSESVVIRTDTLKKFKLQKDSQQNSSGWFTVFEFVQLLVDTLGLIAKNIDEFTNFNLGESMPTDLSKSGVTFSEHLTTLVHTAEDTVDQLALKQISHFHPNSASTIDQLVKDFEAQAVSLRSLFIDLSAHNNTTSKPKIIQTNG